ncbi:SRPBCC family protein [Kribbella sp. NPDC026596]|uniref:SRPBCC family protein n=1 Tax=Kribbella sp. NPDC026596 TaxID=3155122 RepID=UPI0033F298E4
MATITNTIDISANTDDVWTVLADLPATRHWLPGVVSARMDGTLRVCRLADGQEIQERISDISPERRTFRFEHVRVPLPVKHSGGLFTVAAGPAADTATVTLRTTFEPLDPTAADQLTVMIQEAFQRSLESLRRYIEDKLPWDAV